MHLLQRTRQQTAGYILVTGPDGKTQEEYDLVRCCHCQAQFRILPGSGMVRGWCTMCGQTTCGRQPCQPCRPFERTIAAQEQRQRLFQALGL